VSGVLIRCDGSHGLGLGHVVRCLALARELGSRHGRKAAFAMRSDRLGMDLVREAGFPVLEAPDGADFDYVSWLAAAVESAQADTLVVDVRDELSLANLRALRTRAPLRLAAIEDVTDRRLAAEDVFYPPVPQAAALEWPDFAGRVHIGWEWIPLRPEFAAEPLRSPNDRPVVLVAMGGSDPGGLTLIAVRALAQVKAPIDCVALVGPGFRDDAELARLLKTAQYRAHVIRDGDVHAQMIAADLAVLAFGVTAYEAAASALPAVHLCLTEDHALSSSAMARAGMAVSLGLAANVETVRLAEVIGEMLANEVGRGAMGACARSLVDGRGTARIAEVIAASEAP
jgi:spore coat polysaccharide biosynthesis protein SpsF